MSENFDDTLVLLQRWAKDPSLDIIARIVCPARYQSANLPNRRACRRTAAVGGDAIVDVAGLRALGHDELEHPEL